MYQLNTPTLALLSSLPLIKYPVRIVIATLPVLQPGGVGICKRLSWKFGSYSLLVGSNSSISNFLSNSLTSYWVWIMSSKYLSLLSASNANFLQLAMQSATSRSSLAILVTAKVLLSSTSLNRKSVTFQRVCWRGQLLTHKS